MRATENIDPLKLGKESNVEPLVVDLFILFFFKLSSICDERTAGNGTFITCYLSISPP